MTNWALWGTIVNTCAVLVGSLAGLGIKWFAARVRKRAADDELPEHAKKENRVATLVQKGLGLCVLIIGISGALDIQNMLVMIVSVVLGAIVGELLDLDMWLKRFGTFVERRVGGGTSNVAEGFVSATLLFCVGAMTVTGAMESGILHTHDTYYAKAMLDLVASVIFASSLGVGVMLSAAGVFAIQSVLTGIAFFAGTAIPVAVTGEMMAVGSLLVIVIATNLLGITKIKVMNLVPAMLFPLALCPLFELIF